MAATGILQDTMNRSNRKVALIALSAALAMLGLGFASVPLYRMFCEATGFGGTTRRADAAEAATVQATGKTMVVRFDANVERGMPWQFRPLQVKDTVSIGGRDMALFWARNDSDQPITGTASFNVEPEQAVKYFNKIQCFCFTEQTLQPGETAEMPVTFFVDPDIAGDRNLDTIRDITLSYTFYAVQSEGS